MSRLVSPTQRKALEALATGSVIYVSRRVGRDFADAAAIWKDNQMDKISMATVNALQVQGWLEDKGEGYRWRSSTYVISENGREQLEIERGEDQLKVGTERLRSARRAGVRVSWSSK